jgi:hypothetical protein
LKKKKKRLLCGAPHKNQQFFIIILYGTRRTNNQTLNCTAHTRILYYSRHYGHAPSEVSFKHLLGIKSIHTL